jgi:flagellar biosynthesis protein FlhB
MAETERDERTEEPSQRRLQEARDRGQVPRSRELTNFASLIGGCWPSARRWPRTSRAKCATAWVSIRLF